MKKSKELPNTSTYHFKVGNHVDVIRTDRGFEPGYTAIIKSVSMRSTGTYYYDAEVVATRDDKLNKDDRFDIEISHTRDASMA